VSRQFGDVTTGSLPWTTAVRLGGITIAKNFRMRPDLVTYPLPEFAGQAAVPTTVDLLINGQPRLSSDVAPGPYAIDVMPFVNGAGSATLITTDALGRQISTTLPFYVATSLLQQGLVDYSASAGLLRSQFGQQSFGYGAPAASGTLRYGFSNSITFEGHGELS